MKNKIILLIDADADCAGLVLQASARCGREVRLSRNAKEACGFLRREFERIDSLIVDTEPGSHGIGILEALSALQQRPPILVLTGLKESYMAPIAARHSASGCLGKPISIARLQAAINLLKRECSEELSCDSWGHPLIEEHEEVEHGAPA